MRKLFFLCIGWLPLFAVAQKGQEIGIISDNDLYTSSVNDKYYTNGLELYYRRLGQDENPEINKRQYEFKIGQYIYNPHTRFAEDIRRIDRPFAGYLFAEAGRNLFYQNQSVLKTNLQLGYVGPNSFAKEAQEVFHDVFGYKRIYGWDSEIRNALAVQANVFVSKRIVAGFSGDHVDFHVQAEANAGTIFDNLSAGLLARFSLKKLLPVYNSNLYGATANADKSVYRSESEFYFYLNPGVNYQFYDATIQGSLFSNSSPVTFDLVPLRFIGEGGFKFRRNNWNLSYVFVYRGKEVDHPVNTGYFYGSIVIGHML